MSNLIFKNTLDMIRAGVNGAYLENQRRTVIWSRSHTQSLCIHLKIIWGSVRKQEVWQCDPLQFLKETWQVMKPHLHTTCKNQCQRTETGRKQWPFHFNARNEIQFCGCHCSGIEQASWVQHSNENSLPKRNRFNRKKNERMMSGMDPMPNCKGFSEPKYKQNPSDFFTYQIKLSKARKSGCPHLLLLNENAKR